MTITWNLTMSTGVPGIDGEHQEWIRRFNEFDDLVINKRGAEKIQEALDYFSQYAEFHFPHEEELSKDFSASLIEKNKKEHAKYRRKVKNIEESIDSFGDSIVSIIALKIDMEQWLIEHITNTDVQLFNS